MGHVVVAVLIYFYTFVFAEQYTTTENYETTTISEVPTKPLNLSVLDVGSNSLILHWYPPRRANGAIEGYRMYYIRGNYTDVQTLHTGGHKRPAITHNLTRLYPDSEYKIWVKAFTGKNEGDSSDAVYNRTDISGPDAPHIVNLTCQKQDTMYVQWQRPTKYYQGITYYYIYISGEYYEDNTIIQLPADPEHLDVSFSIKNMTTDTMYEVRLGAASWSTYTGRLIPGNLSYPVLVHMRTNCDKFQYYMMHTTGEFSIGMIAGVACAVAAFILAIMAFVIWRKYFHIRYYPLDDPNAIGEVVSIDWNATPESDEHKGPIPVNLFRQHVAELHADSDIGFSKEYEQIQGVQAQASSENSLLPENRSKNRYLNITAYDHTRVHLLQVPGAKKTIDYINANYIDGFSVTKAYIGTQGPLPSTFDSFWRMIWEQRVAIIVMITNLVERGRRKCDMYWPKEGAETYGVIQVKLVKEDVMATYTVRTLQIRHLRIKKKKDVILERFVYQYHYTNWPDHGTPDHPLPVLHFIRKSSAANPEDAGPIIVHCSAGVGRTGTYIMLDAMMRQIRERNEVNICGFLRHIRTQRNFLVQTEEQYIFIHDALLEIIEPGETNVTGEQFCQYMDTIISLEDDEDSKWKSIETQFKLVTSFHCRDINVLSGTKLVNQPKNRSNRVIPVESSRVHLTPKPGEDGSDYINASWIQGFHGLREFIITQHPLPHTIPAFWQMVWDHNVQIIVILTDMNNEDYEMFWPPPNGTIAMETFSIRHAHEITDCPYESHAFALQSLQDDYELHVKTMHCNNWPNCENLPDILEFPKTVMEKRYGYQNGPVVVMDRYGASDAATFCALISLKNNFAYDNHIDVYMYAKLYHSRRPGIWSAIDDYIRLHFAVRTFCPIQQITEEDEEEETAVNGSLTAVAIDDGTIHITPEGMEAVEPQLTVA